MGKFAAVDIGSNSMRLLVAEVNADGGITRLAEDRQVTRLGESVFSHGQLSPEAMDTAATVLRRFRSIVESHSIQATRIVATSATRDASNQQEFLERCRASFGTPIEIISGLEEARLIGLGVSAVWPQGDDPILIVDVGGGSAEFILSQGGEMVDGYSRPLGAVRLKEVFLDKDPPKLEQILRLQEFIDEKLELVVRRLGGRPFVRMIATSATAAAVVCAVNGIPRAERSTADRKAASLEQVRRLYRELIESPLEKRRKLAGIGPRRAEIIVAGTAVFLRAMERFDAPQMFYCGGGVRDGIVLDLAYRGVDKGRLSLDESDRRAVEMFAKRYGVALGHARFTASHAVLLFRQLRAMHQLDANYSRLLEAACYLLDVGHYVSDTSHHKHSHYLVANSDFPGFTDQERRVIALLCRYHRKSMPAPRHKEWTEMSVEDRRAIELLAPFVRIAEALDRSRDQHVRLARCEVRGDEVQLTLEVNEGKDCALEQWALERTARDFRAVYGKGLSIAVS
jgi:exopolyphosphatase / guanosine-5'-triphosphate,3'-diphosphate pyrophosphatase